MTAPEPQTDSWIYIVPIQNLQISPDLGVKVKVGRVMLLTKSSLSRLRRRLDIPLPISSYWLSDMDPLDQSSENSKYAAHGVVRETGTSEEVSTYAWKEVQDAVRILATSFYPWMRRGFFCPFGVGLQGASGRRLEMLIGTGTGQSQGHWGALGGVIPAQLTREWWRCCKQKWNGFRDLLQIFDGSRGTECTLVRALRSAAIFAGRSWLATGNRADCLLFGWIALEIMLLDSQDKTETVLVRRLENLFNCESISSFARGRDQESKRQSIQENVKRLFKLRCALVHRGDASGVT
jgi:hypothetical protein